MKTRLLKDLRKVAYYIYGIRCVMYDGRPVWNVGRRWKNSDWRNLGVLQVDTLDEAISLLNTKRTAYILDYVQSRKEKHLLKKLNKKVSKL